MKSKKILGDRKYLLSFKSYGISSQSSVKQRQENGVLRQRILFKRVTIARCVVYYCVRACVCVCMIIDIDYMMITAHVSHLCFHCLHDHN